VAPSPAPLPRPEGQELILWHSYEGVLRDALLAQVDEFNAANPWRIVVVPEYHGDARQLGAELLAAVETGAPPDLVIRDPSDVWALGEAVAPVQTYVKDKRFGLTADDLKDIYPAMLDMARDPKEKTLLSFPLGGEGVVLVYNADRLATQNYFTPPTSWPLFKEICEATTLDTTGDSRVDVYGFGFDPRADFATAWLNSRGGSIETIELNDPRYRSLDDSNQPVKVVGDDPLLKLKTTDVTIEAIDRQLAALGLSLAKIDWEVVPGSESPEGVTFRFTSPDGSIQLEKAYRLPKVPG
jgi:ABC-type glycerol-3-phosphate transport system substrate-binding protein